MPAGYLFSPLLELNRGGRRAASRRLASFGHVHRALFSEARVRLLPRDRKVTVVTARLNGKWPSTPKYRAKMVDATQKVQTVILDGAKIFFGRHGSLRPTMKNRGRIPDINPPRTPKNGAGPSQRGRTRRAAPPDNEGRHPPVSLHPIPAASRSGAPIPVTKPTAARGYGAPVAGWVVPPRLRRRGARPPLSHGGASISRRGA